MRTARAVPTPVAVKENHDLPNDLLLRPGVRDPLGPNRANPRHLAKPAGLGLDNVEDLLTERLDHFAGVDWADAPDHAGGQVFLDTVDRGRGRRPHELRLELLTVGTVIDPFARRRDPFTSGDDRGMTDDRHKVAMAPSLGPQYAEAVFGIVEGHPLNQAGKDLSSRRWQLTAHPGLPGTLCG